MNTEQAQVQLSKWWQSESCRQAFERAAKARAERIAKVRQQFAERQEKLKRDVETWSVRFGNVPKSLV